MDRSATTARTQGPPPEKSTAPETRTSWRAPGPATPTPSASSTTPGSTGSSTSRSGSCATGHRGRGRPGRLLLRVAQPRALDDPEAFGGWLLRIARNAASTAASRSAAPTAVDDEGLAVIESARASPRRPPGFGVEDRLGRVSRPGPAVEDAEIVSLVWRGGGRLPRPRRRGARPPAPPRPHARRDRRRDGHEPQRRQPALPSGARPSSPARSARAMLWHDGQPACPDLRGRALGSRHPRLRPRSRARHDPAR